ncbi:MAG: adenylate kinase family protein, partial [Chthoniobacterales bacterium]
HLDRALDHLKAPLELVVLLELPEQEIRRRILERLSCLACGATFSSSLHGYVEGGACPNCGAPLVRRNDDTEAALAQRLEVYNQLTLPVVSYYEKTAPRILHRVDAGQGSDAIFAKIAVLVENKECQANS